MIKIAYKNGKHDLRRGIDFIGVTCSFVCYDKQVRVLLGKRSKLCRDEQGRWDTGGGAHEFGDTFEATVKREILEEYGATSKKLQFVKAYDALRLLDDDTPTHWVAIVYAVLVDPFEVSNNEPAKIDEIGWYHLNNLPKPLHSQVDHTLVSVRKHGYIK